MPRPILWIRFLLLLGLFVALANPALGQVARAQADLADRPISAVDVVGLKRVSEQLIRNNIRAAVGDPYDAEVSRTDVARLYQLGAFQYVTAEAELQLDGSVRVIYTITEQPVIAEVQVVGNTLISDQELRGVVGVVRGGPRDDYLIENARRAIENRYRQRGHYLVSVAVDSTELDSAGLLIFRVMEGPRVRVRAIEFQGNTAFQDRKLLGEIRTRTAIFLFRRGQLDEDMLLEDVAKLDRFYRDRGYLEVRVDREIQLSPDNKEAKVVFRISEGPIYTLRSLRVINYQTGGAPEVFTPDQLLALMEIRPGDVYSGDRIRNSIAAIEDAYGRIGRANVRMEAREPIRVGPQPEVDLLLEIDEGMPTTVGLVHVQGNLVTQDKVVRRELRGIEQGRPLDATDIERSKRRLLDTRHFNDVRITLLDPEDDDEGMDGEGLTESELEQRRRLSPKVRDVLVEVKERNTGSLNFGVAVGSDSGVFGEFSLNQTNFDIADFPASWGDLFRGKAFRGAGQSFNMTFRPGNEIFEYSMSFFEPKLFDTDYSLRIGGAFNQRFYREFDEERITGSFALGRQLGDYWEIALRGRGERVSFTAIDRSAPTEFFLDRGPDVITSLGVGLTRTTIATLTRPGRGSRFQIGFDRVGAMGGDFNYNMVTADYTVFMTISEDFLGRKTTLRLNTDIGYQFGGDRVPTYERFYRGGRSFRGFKYRTISPKGIRNDNGLPSREGVGGTWMFFAGAQYEFPIFGEMVTGVFFMDTGTVTSKVGFDDYRVSIGTGIRLYIPQLGPVPIAFDFGFPVLKQSRDEKQLLTFSAELPF
ncbi:MAG TPA: POTRA domain-containing protein [Phycisphaerales bacterium]|nr:POTRA domain-containing protein [Phycisphaerales bacterium]